VSILIWRLFIPATKMKLKLADNDPERHLRVERERQAAKAILDDPKSDQLSRDLAHLRLQHEEGMKADGAVAYGDLTEEVPYQKVPEEWLTVEAYEAGMAHYSDVEIVSLVEAPLLLNKCKTIRATFLPNGKPSIELAYPRLSLAVENIIGTSMEPETLAKAHAVKACLIRPVDKERSIVHYKKAIRVRPSDWRLRNAIASSYMSLQNVPLSLESLTQAVTMTDEDSFERFEVESSRGKVLFNLGRFNEAEDCFLSVLKNAEIFKDKISPIDFAHLIVVEYQLCIIYVMEKKKGKVEEYWNSAEAKFNALAPEVRSRIDWESRQCAQMSMGISSPNLLSHQECHHCRQLCTNPKICSACKAARYCSKECQKAAWKAGHKQNCKQENEDRRETKKERKLHVKKNEAAKNLPPLDGKLDPYVLWAKAKKCSQPMDAVFYFTLALFLDFSLDAQDFAPVCVAVKKCPNADHPLVLALDILPQVSQLRGPSTSILEHADSNRHKALSSEHAGNETSETIDDIDRVSFGIGMCHIFQARLMGRVYAVKSDAQSQDPEVHRAFDDIAKLIDTAANIFMDYERWLTLQFELGYSNFDIGATDEARRWFDIFIESLNKLEKNNGNKLSKHWKKYRKTARQKAQLIPLIRRSNDLGRMP
jgi:tetratricopeptide (TPR) repeat protein